MINDLIAQAQSLGLVSVCLRPDGCGWTLAIGFSNVPAACAFGRLYARGSDLYKAADDHVIVNCPVQVRSERPHPLATQRWDLRAMSQADAQWALGLYAQL
jgi:hypothetical protein